MAARVRRMTAALRELKHDLISEKELEDDVLRDLSEAVAELQVPLWIRAELSKHELLETPHSISSFLVNQSILRLARIVKDLCADIEEGAISTESKGLLELVEAFQELEERLNKLPQVIAVNHDIGSRR